LRKYNPEMGEGRKILIIVFFTFVGIPLFSQQLKLTINITNVRTDRGRIELALCNDAIQFPHNPGRTYSFEKSSLKGNTLNIQLSDIPPGEYAISVLDDENGDEQMNYNLLRMPKEGFGFSNNVKPRLKAPPFEKCSFYVEGDSVLINIEMQYHRGST